MAHPEENNQIYWYDPDPRTIIPLDDFHVSKRLERTIRQGKFELRFDDNFKGVMQGCASAKGRENTWISDDIIELYSTLFEHGYAHSAETYLNNQLVGGVYGVSVRGLFAGESMFHTVTDASKVALVSLLRHVKQDGFSLFDVQFTTSHLKTFGAKEISRHEYQKKLELALQEDVYFSGH